MKKKMAARHFLNGLALTLLLALGASLVYLTVLLSSDSFSDDSRVKRSLLGDHEFLFKNSLHKVHWSKKQISNSNNNNNNNNNNVVKSKSQSELPNPHRFDKKSDLDHIFISVKTATKFHLERLQVILDTWFKLAPEQVSICFV